MKTKKLFILVSDCGDGSYITRYTFNEDWINHQQQRYDNDELEFDGSDIGVDGDGFHYDYLNVPIECTMESLGIRDCVS